jgi:hypothetical protein
MDATAPRARPTSGAHVTNPIDDEAQVREAYRRLYRAMLAGDTRLLHDLIDEEFTLTHMTGYRQSKQEWLEQIDSGEMRYHSAQERGASVQVKGDAATLIGKDVVRATIWGTAGTWNLQLTVRYARRDRDWIALEAVATTY